MRVVTILLLLLLPVVAADEATWAVEDAAGDQIFSESFFASTVACADPATDVVGSAVLTEARRPSSS